MGREAFDIRESQHELMGKGRSKGCNISVPVGFVLLLLVLVLCVGVALIVFFATKDNSAATPPDCPTNSLGQDGVWWNDAECVAECIKEGICGEDNKPVTSKTTATASTTVTMTTTTASTTSTTTTKSPDQPDKIRDVRLPDWLEPVSYVVEMTPDIYKADPADFTNTGSVSVLMNCVEATSLVTIHSNKLVIEEYSLEEENGAAIDMPNEPVYDLDRQFVNFTLAAPLTVGTQYRLKLKYSGPLNNDLAGLYYSSYDAPAAQGGGAEKRYIATTQYQPTDARKAFPCFDEPALKANFTISLRRKTGYTALSNMPLFNTTTEPNGWFKDNFEETVKMSTYLLAMIVCDFDYKENYTTNGVRFRVYSRPSAINQTDYALAQGVDILTYFEGFFNDTYPLPKQDMIAIPDFAAGAMENWGLITYRETALLYDEDVSAASNKQRVAVVVSHELAHQWFGNLVSPSWWDDLWLNEGFASYVEYIGVDHTEPTWQMMDQFVTGDVQNTLKSDSLATSHPIYVEVQHPDEINEIFDSISYGKGGSLIRMMRYFLGDSIFQTALSNYIDDKAYDAAHHTDLWRAMQDEADKQQLKDNFGNSLDIQGILDTWIKQMGYPLLQVTKNPDQADGKDHLSITQSHFLQDDTQTPDPRYPSPFDYKWDVPVSYVTDMTGNFDVNETSVEWFYRSEASMDITVESSIDWLIINPKQYGFYRVNYPEDYWQKLINVQSDHPTSIHELNRAQIIDDAFNLALAGKLRITYAMELTKYLGSETSYFPWDAAIGSLSYVSSALERTSAYGDFKSYYKSLITPYYNTFNGGWVFDSDAPIVEQYRQSSSISRACAYDVGDCRTRAKTLLGDWMTTGDNTIHPNVRSTVYCHGIKAGGVDEWDFIFEKFSTENVAGEQVKLLQSLGCTNELWLLQRLLDYAVDDDYIRKQDSYIAVGAVAGNTIGRFLAWDWLRANWESLSENFSGGGGSLIQSFVKSTTSKLTTQYQLEQMEAFTAEKGDLGTATRAFAQAKEKTQNNIKYLELNQDALTEWLRTNAP